MPTTDRSSPLLSLAERRWAAALRAGTAMTIANPKVSDEGVGDDGRTWTVNPRDPNEIVGRCPVSVSYTTDSPPGYYEDDLLIRVRFQEGSAVPDGLSAEMANHDPDNPYAPPRQGLVRWPEGFLDEERRRAVADEQAVLQATMGETSSLEASARPRL